METKDIIEAIRVATGGTFIGLGSYICTRMGWEQIYDKKGRLLNADPNYYQSSVNINGLRYVLVRKGWNAYIFKNEYQKASYTWLWRDNLDDYLLDKIDLTPDYLK